MAQKRDLQFEVWDSARKARRWALGLVLVAVFAFEPRAFAQQVSVVQANLVLATDAVHAGSLAKAAVIAEVAPGYHINAHKPSQEYLIPTEVKINPSPLAKLISAEYPKAQSRKFVFEDAPLAVYEGKVLVTAMLRIPASVQPGTYSLDGELSYQACNDHACLPPARAPFNLSMRVVAQGVALKPEHADIFGKSSKQPPSKN